MSTAALGVAAVTLPAGFGGGNGGELNFVGFAVSAEANNEVFNALAETSEGHRATGKLTPMTPQGINRGRSPGRLRGQEAGDCPPPGPGLRGQLVVQVHEDRSR